MASRKGYTESPEFLSALELFVFERSLLLSFELIP